MKGVPAEPSATRLWRLCAGVTPLGVLVCGCALNDVRGGASAAAEWIQPRTATYADSDVGLFRRFVVNDKPVAKAEWTVAALGAFEAYANGTELGGGFLKGGFTQPEKCRHAHTLDATPQWHCAAGATNELLAAVSASWWRDAIMRRDLVRKMAGYPRNSALNATLRLTYADGSAAEVPTDASWDATYAGDVVRAGIYEGETQNLIRRPPYDEFDAPRWEPAAPNADFDGEIRPVRGSGVLLREDLALKADAKLPMTLQPGREYVFDFGQNCSAVERLVVEGLRLGRVTVRHAEMLNEPGGDPARGNDGPGGTLYLTNLRYIDAMSTYVLADGRQTLQPRFTFFGYRYVGVTVTKPVTLLSLESVPVTSVTAASESASFECGDAAVNKLVSNIRWGFRSNYLSVPTDCPQRNERLGWTADTMVFVPAASYLADVRGPLGKWLADLRDTQSAEGAFEQLAPLVWSASHKVATSGWSDAGVIVPYLLWKHYGDRTLADEDWAAMQRYVGYVNAHEGADRSCYGDWLSYEHRPINPETGRPGQPLVYREIFSAFYWIWDLQAMQEMAAAFGRPDEARRYAADEVRARAFFRRKYCGADGLLRPEFRGQTADLYMLKLGLCPSEATRAETKADLVRNIREHGTRLQTGFMGTAVLMETLSEVGETGLAYDLLLQHENPSWLYSVDQGATTVWERWDSYTREKGFGNPDMNSFNHYAYGAVFSWMMKVVAGIRPDPKDGGFAHFVLAPRPDSRLGFVKAAYDSPKGRIVSEWTCKADGTWQWRYVVPQGTTATVLTPDGRTLERTAGDYQTSEVVAKPLSWCGETPHLRRGGVLASPAEEGFATASSGKLK